MPLGQILTNGYFWLGCISTILVIVQMVLILRRAHYSATIFLLELYLGTLAIVNIAQVGQFFGRNATVFDVAQLTFAAAIIIYPVCLLYFVLHFLNRRRWIESLWLPAILLVGTFFFLVAGLGLHAVYAQDPSLRVLKGWGYVIPHIAKLQLPITLWIETLVTIPLVLLIIAYRHTSDRVRKRQTLIVIAALVVPNVFGSVTQGVLPGIFHIDVLPSTLYVQAIQAILLSYALLRYSVTTIDPNAIASSIVQTMNSAAVALGRDGRILFVNAATEKLLGTTPKTLVGRPVRALLAPDEWPKFKKDFLQPMEQSGNARSAESVLAVAEGHVLPVNAYGSAYRDRTGRILATIIIFADIKELKQLLADATRLGKELAVEKQSVEAKVVERTREVHEEQAKLRASIEGLTVGFMLMDNTDHIVVQNRALRKIFDLPSRIESPTQLTELLTNCDLVAQCQKAKREGQHEIKEVGMGAKILHLFVGPVIVEGNDKEEVIGTVILVQDITEEKVLARSRDEFFSIASHELNTPLTAIKGNASLMLGYFSKVLNKEPQLKELVHDIQESSVRLIGIVRDFLDVSRIEQGKMVFRKEAVALDKVMESLLYEMRPIVNSKHITLTTDTHTLDKLPKVWGDKDRITQILYNLIGNGLKFTDTGSVTIDTTVEGKVVRLRVSDTGRGISINNQKLLFHKFQQAGDSPYTRDTTRGTGLGLYISKLMVESMGGSIGLESSEEGKGSVFFLELPIATEAQRAAQKS